VMCNISDIQAEFIVHCRNIVLYMDDNKIDNHLHVEAKFNKVRVDKCHYPPDQGSVRPG